MTWTEALRDVLMGLLLTVVVLCFLFSDSVGKLIESLAR